MKMNWEPGIESESENGKGGGGGLATSHTHTKRPEDGGRDKCVASWNFLPVPKGEVGEKERAARVPRTRGLCTARGTRYGNLDGCKSETFCYGVKRYYRCRYRTRVLVSKILLYL